MAERVPTSVSFWPDTSSGAPPTVIIIPDGKDVFAVLERTFRAVDEAGAKRAIDKPKPSGENSRTSSSLSSVQHGHAPGPKPQASPPQTSPDEAPGAVPPVADLFAPVNDAQQASCSVATRQAATAPFEGRIEGSNPSGSTTDVVAPGAGGTRDDERSGLPESTGGREKSPCDARQLLLPPAPGVRDTSMAAYRALEWSGKLADQQMTVLSLFLANPTARRTRKEVAAYAGLEINAVCGRVAELIAGPFHVLVEDAEKKVCSITKNRVTALRLARVDEILITEEEVK